MTPVRPYWSPAETLAADEQAARRLAGVRELLDWLMQKSPFYGARLRAAGVDPRAIGSLRDFAEAVPLTTKQDLRDAMAEFGSALPHLCVPREQVVLAGPSAGTSGRQTYQAFTAEDVATNVEISARLFWCCGLRPGDVFHLLVTPFTPAAQIFRLAAARIGVKWIIQDDHEPGHVPRYVDVAGSLEPTFLQAGVATLRAMAAHARAGTGTRRLGAYRSAILMGAALGAEARRDFREQLGIDVFTLSGQGSDFNLFSTQCEAHDGEHWHADDLTLVELIDPATGRPAAEGTLGELVITDFYRRASPHLRWRTEDMYSLHTGPCACGRSTRRFTLHDRLANRVPVAGRSVYPFQVEECLSRSRDGRNLEFSLIRRSTETPELDLRLLKPPTLADGQADKLAHSISTHLSHELGLPVSARFQDKLPYVGYKTVRVIDEN
ncbi:MAG: Phenylacetate-coenzyme A ligase [Rhodocyclaceae bacterium]|nr:Phenylacetate-coenzyme A ligase [Rhodocyclaceae bacterium]